MSGDAPHVLTPVTPGEPMQARTITEIHEALQDPSPVHEGRTADWNEYDDLPRYKQLFDLYHVFASTLKIRGDKKDWGCAIAGAFGAPAASGSGMSFDTKIDLSAETDDQVIYIKVDRAAGTWSLEKADEGSFGDGDDTTEHIVLWYVPLDTSGTDAIVKHTEIVDLRSTVRIPAFV